MVYRGRPSTGCLRCRKRKIKCDERQSPDGCLKCVDKNLVCPGYEDETDRLFRDESENVKQKAIKAKSKAVALRNERYKTDSSASSPSSDITSPIPVSPEIVGINFFMQNMAYGLDKPAIDSPSYYDHASTFGFHPVIAATMSAIGLASFAGLTKDYTLRDQALRLYIKAIRRTNAALASPHELKNDSTLLAVNLLGIFEAILGSSASDSVVIWAKHIMGTSSLIKARGKEQLATYAGRRMFFNSAAEVIMIYTGRGFNPPDHIRELIEEISRHGHPKDPVLRFYQTYIQYAAFRADLIHKRTTDLQEILHRALELDRISEAVFADAGPVWQYQVVPTNGDVEGVFGDHYHIYPHYLAAQTWNWLRPNRIGLNDIIRAAILKGRAETPPRFTGPKYTHILNESIAKLYQIQADILASIPQHLHDVSMDYDPTRPVALTTRTLTTHTQPRFLWSNFRTEKPFPSRTPGVSNERLPCARTTGNSLLWPLYLAGAISIATPESQQYVMQSLMKIADRMGINQARVLAQALALKIQYGNEETFEIPPYYMLKSSPQAIESGQVVADYRTQIGIVDP